MGKVARRMLGIAPKGRSFARGLAAAHPAALRLRGSDSMSRQQGFWRRHAARLAALALILVLYGFARMPALTPAERTALAARFAFQRIALPRLPAALGGVAGPGRTVRQVNPSVAN